MFGLPGSTAAHLIAAGRPAVVDVGSAATSDDLIAGLEAEGVDSLDSIVLTHIHFDHAGGAGHLAARFPEATIYIHERVAKYLTEPEVLIEGVRSVWGPKTDELFGLPKAIPAERVRGLADGDTIDLGDRRLHAVATPGHTRAHMVYLDESTGAVVCGDAIGLQVPGSRVLRAATPPADCSLPDALESVERIRELNAESLYLAHFGLAEPNPDTVCDEAIAALRGWREAYERERELSDGDEDLVRRMHCALEAGLEPVSSAVRSQFEAINPAWLNVDGMNGEARRLARQKSA